MDIDKPMMSEETTKKKDKRKQVGTQGEMLAVEYLKTKGYEIVISNWKCKSGEIDIIAQMEQMVVFIEVRTRLNKGSYGTPQESVNDHKQRKVRNTARVYIHQHGKYNESIRFDVIAIYLKADGSLLELNHIANAF